MVKISGHSKWNNIKNKKEKTDAQRGKIFTKLGRELSIAVKQGGADPSSNAKLKDAIAKCKANNMPNDNIDRTIKKASGEGNASSYEEIVYEGYGPAGVAIIVEATTDNKNRTAADVRHIFDKFGGKLGTSGCVSFMFQKKGIIVIEKKDSIDEEELMMQAIEAGAEDLNAQEEYFEIITLPENFSSVTEKLEEAGYTFAEAEVQLIPDTYVTLDEKTTNRMRLIIENLEDNEDVSNIYHNWEE